MKKIIILLLLSLNVNATDWLDINLASKHLKSRSASSPPYNERNYGAGFQNSSYAFGFYNNSYHKTSFYFGGVSEWNWKHVSAGMMYGGITGYERVSGYKIMPALIPYVAFPIGKHVRAKLLVIPAVIGFSLQIKL